MSAKNVLSHSFWICWKDLVEFSRSKMRVIMLILMPLFMMAMVGFIFPSNNTTIKDQPVAVANLDVGYALYVPQNHTNISMNMSQILIEQINLVNNQTGMMKLSGARDFDEIKTRIQNGELSAGIIIPINFTREIVMGRQGSVEIVTDQSNPQLSATMQIVLSKTIEAIGTQVAMYKLNTTYNISMNYTISYIKPYNVEYRGIVEGESNYFQFVAPGIIAMTLMMSVMTGLPHAISYERDVGTLDGMLMAPIHRISIILGKVLAQTIRGLVQAVIIFLLAVFLFGVTIHGNIILVVLLILLTVYSFVGLGILITSFSDREETAAMVMMTLMFPMMFMSGVFFPIQQMPEFMQMVAKFLPLTYATTALRKVMVLGADTSAVSLELAILIGFGTILLAVSVPVFKRAMTR
ncbi:MAG: ABC transporter permease [Thermoplasmata archaeon]|nr:ABC transporter permease [Thermoplasmata archaeon]